MEKKILVIDDEKDIADFLEKNLRLEGYEVDSASDGEEAKKKTIESPPDIIILDLIMPNLDGWGFLRWLRQEVRLTIPTIIVSAKDDLDDMKKGYALETDTYLIKPVSVEDVLRAIRVVCFLDIEKK